MIRIALAAFAALAVVACSLGQPPGGPYPRTCVDVPEEVCEGQAAAAEDALPPIHPPIAGFEVRCTAVSCTADSGEGETIVRFTDGSSTTLTGWGYATPVGTPPEGPPATRDPSVPVTCVGMPDVVCDERADEVWTFDEILDADSPVASITIRCTSQSCDPDAGDGTTLVRLADGTTREIGWNYQTGD